MQHRQDDASRSFGRYGYDTATGRVLFFDRDGEQIEPFHGSEKATVDATVSAGRLAAAEIVNPKLPRSITLGLTQHHPLSRAARLVLSRLHELIPPMTRPDSMERRARR